VRAALLALLLAGASSQSPDAAPPALELLAKLSHVADFSLGCYCEDATRCHRSVLRELLAERGARFA